MFERLKQLITEIKENTNISAEDKKGILKIAEYLLTRSDMNEKYNNQEKSLLEMWKFIKEEAKEKAINGVAVMDDEEVYSIAIHYFDESNEKLKMKSKNTKASKKASARELDNTKENEEIKQQEEISSEVDNKNATTESKNDDEIVMIFKGQPVTYKQFKEGTYLTR